MKVSWKYEDLNAGLGHGITFALEGLNERETLGFIEGYEWRNEIHPKMTVFLDQRLKVLPASITTELRLAMLLFITDRKRQHDGMVIHGFKTNFNA